MDIHLRNIRNKIHQLKEEELFLVGLEHFLSIEKNEDIIEDLINNISKTKLRICYHKRKLFQWLDYLERIDNDNLAY